VDEHDGRAIGWSVLLDEEVDVSGADEAAGLWSGIVARERLASVRDEAEAAQDERDDEEQRADRPRRPTENPPYRSQKRLEDWVATSAVRRESPSSA
jgi:hypothetical protein